MASAEITHRGVRRVLIVTLFLNLAVSAGKLLVGSLSGSLAMGEEGVIQPGKTVGWIFATEEKGARMK